MQILSLCLDSLSFFSDIHDEPQVYYLGFTAPIDVITVCFLQSAEHYYASQEEHEILSAYQQDTNTAVVSEVAETEYMSLIDTNTLER